MYSLTCVKKINKCNKENIKLVIFGLPSSGKSSIIKQMKFDYGKSYSEEELVIISFQIRNLIKSTIVNLFGKEYSDNNNIKADN